MNMQDPFDGCGNVPTPIDQLQELIELAFKINDEKNYTVYLEFRGQIARWELRVFKVKSVEEHIRMYDWDADQEFHATGFLDDQASLDDALIRMREFHNEA